MLNKENTKKAEQVRDQLAPLFAHASKLADLWSQSATTYRKARDRAFFWLYVGSQGGNPYGETLTEEEKNTARELRANNPKEWHTRSDAIFEEEHHAETQERARWFNFSNYCRYIGEVLGELLRPFVWDILDKKGLETLTEIINPQTFKDYKAHTLKASIRKDWLFDDSLHLIITIYGGGSCGAWFSDYSYYNRGKTQPQDITPPQPMTAKQYADRLAKLKAYETKAQALQKEQRAKAKEWGLLDACELLEFPKTTKYR